MRFPIRLWAALILAVWATVGAAHAQSGFDRRGGDYTNFQVRNGDPAVCAARCERDRTLPRLELLIPTHGERNCDLLVEEPGPGTYRGQVLRFRCSRCRRHRAPQGTDRIFHRQVRRRLPQLGNCNRFCRRALQGSVRGRQQMPRMDLCAAGLHWRCCALLSQGPTHAAAEQAMLHFRRSEVATVSALR